MDVSYCREVSRVTLQQYLFGGEGGGRGPGDGVLVHGVRQVNDLT
jgi:hypothetical protein